jgi:solute:Na+ symporter, SSS family
MVAAGAWVSRRVRTSGDFFVAGRGLSGGMVFVTLLAANIGAGSTVGATGLGYRHGLSAWWWSGSAALGCLVLGLFVVPRLHAQAAQAGFLTVGDFLEARYDRGVRGIIAAVLWLGTLAILAGQLIAMAWALEVLLAVPKPIGCAVAGVVVVAYVWRGGLLASAWVNLIQLVVLLLGFSLAVPFGWQEAGGWEGLRQASGATDAARYGSLTGMGWMGVLGLAVLFVPSFICSPGLVQKTYGARSPAAARAGTVANAAVLAVFAFIPALLGMAARATRPGLANPELALPTLMAEVLPGWLGALGLAALFAAELSTADAVLFMLSTSLSQDLYKAFLRPDADDARLLAVGRWTTVAAGALGIALAVRLPSVADALKSFYGIMTTTLFVPFVGGLLTRRGGAGAARAAIGAAAACTLAGLVVWRGTPFASWAPFGLGLAAAAVTFTTAAVLAGRRPT